MPCAMVGAAVRGAAPNTGVRGSKGVSSSFRTVKVAPAAGAGRRVVVVRAMGGPKPPVDPDTISDPLLRQAVKEPVAFLGGMVAGLLRLDLSSDPLRGWIEKTAQDAGTTVEDAEASGSSMVLGVTKTEDDEPEEIVIE